MDESEIPDREQATDPPAPANGLPQHTTPTWEVELLISGIAVFAMLQLPGWMDNRYFDLLPRFDAFWQQALKFGYLYARVGAVILAGTFVLHLLLRSQWIALVGMDSVYPRGVQWDRLRMGAQQRAVTQQRLGTVGDAIERADNRATIVFAVGVYSAMQMLKLVALVGAGAAVFYAARLAGFRSNESASMLLAAAVILPMLVIARIDRLLGERIAPASRTSRLLRGLFVAYAAVGLGRGAMPGWLLMASNEGQRRVATMTAMLFVSVAAITVWQLHVDKQAFGLGNYGALAGYAPGALRPDHYDDQRDGNRFTTLPFVQSQVVADPYLRVVVPVDPVVDARALQDGCPSRAVAASARDAACIGAAHPLTLDGRALAVPYDLGSDVKAHRPALVAMIDVRALPPGRHLLRVGRPTADGEAPSVGDLIPFWR